jgi:2-(1,2-epoxy-1,2-dihydrophenyl)acetyl-CoA isomerase
MEQAVKFEQREGLLILTLNRPEEFNAFGTEIIDLLVKYLTETATDPKVTGVIITGEGKAFCDGGNLRCLSGYGKSVSDAFHTLAARFHQAMIEIRRMPKPVVAAINGLAAGGGFSLALGCDFRVMEKTAVLKQAYTSNGLSIDGGGTFTLPRLVGLARAMEIIAFDKPISAEQALTWGLVTEVVDPGQALDRAVGMIQVIEKMPLTSFAASKKLLLESFNTSIETQLERERELLAWCADSPNGREGVRAFLEKRKPVFNKKDQ